jgi:hypothetical protein
VESADSYIIFRKYKGLNETEIVTTIDNLEEVTTDGVTMVLEVDSQESCSTATYSVQALRSGVEEPAAVACDSPTTILLNDTDPYKAEDLIINTQNREDTELKWIHKPCIESYTVIFSPEDGDEIEKEVAAEWDEDVVTMTTNNLDDCSLYSITIIPRFLGGSIWEAYPVVQERIQRKKEIECRPPVVTVEASQKLARTGRSESESGSGSRSGSWKTTLPSSWLCLMVLYHLASGISS